jgi:heat shock protein HslJ
MYQRWWRRAALMLLPVSAFAIAFVMLVPNAPAQTQGVPMPDLIGTKWLLEDLGGSGVIDNAQATLEFPKPGEVAGMGSCNHFFGLVEIKVGRVSFDKMASTQMQCADAVSDQEQRYLAALAGAERISVEGPYLFIHSKGLDKPLRFTQLQKP